MRDLAMGILRRIPLIKRHRGVIQRDYSDYRQSIWNEDGSYSKMMIRYFTGLVSENLSYSQSLEKLKSEMKEVQGREEVLETLFEFRGWGKYHSVRPMQNRDEMLKVAEILNDKEIDRCIEIGTARGGSFLFWTKVCSPETMISVDMPDDSDLRPTRDKPDFLKKLSEAKENIFIRGNSHSKEVKNRIREIEGGFDFAFIDGDHSYEGVKQDFEFVKPMMNEGGVILFHDITEKTEGVHRFWNEIKDKETTEQIIKSSNAGIGIIHL